MAETQTYDDLPYTQFPVNVDTFEDMQDVSLDTYDWVKQYNTYFAAGNIKSAQALLAAHPELQKCLFNATKMNRMSQAIKAMERFYKEDIARVVNNAAKNTVGINDDPTEDEAKVNSYSAKKINDLLESTEQKLETEINNSVKSTKEELELKITNIDNDLSNLKNATILLTSWDGTGPWTSILSVEGITENDSPLIFWNNTASTSLLKKQQQKSWNMIDECTTENGSITFTCKFKKPLVDIPIGIKGR